MLKDEIKKKTKKRSESPQVNLSNTDQKIKINQYKANQTKL